MKKAAPLRHRGAGFAAGHSPLFAATLRCSVRGDRFPEHVLPFPHTKRTVRHSRCLSAAFVASLLLLSSTGTFAQAVVQNPGAAARWWHHVTVLADDSLRGRATGTEDYLKAARYVADQMKQAGLEPGGTDGFFQAAKLTTARLVPEQSGMVLVTGASIDTLHAGTDASMAMSTTIAPRVEGPMVFVGYGLHLPGIRDDIAGVDVKGKVVVYLNRMPTGLNTTMMAHGRSARWDLLRHAGAIAAIAIADPLDTANGRGRGAGRAGGGGGGGGRGASATGLADDPTGGGMLINMPAATAERLFTGSGHTFAEMFALAKDEKPMPAVPLTPVLRAWSQTERTPLEAPNVVGILRGSDPTLRNEYLLVTAHLDHLGVTRAVDGDSINNGAIDNASGVATLLEVAERFDDGNLRSKRSVIFIALTGEERGELGSAYFATHPTVPANQIVADLNTDMWWPLIPLKGVIGYGTDESDLGTDLKAVLARHNLVLFDDPEPAQVRFIRSDQYSFIKRGTPALAFKAGFIAGSPEAQIIANWNSTRYHKVTDDVNQPIDFQCAADFNAMYFDLVQTVANRATRPAYFSQSVFKMGSGGDRP
jgi:hypothetical protein